jgi:hypothetical protein
MTADTELIAVGITKIGTVVVGMIVRAKAGRALGASTSGQRRLMAVVDGGAIGRQRAIIWPLPGEAGWRSNGRPIRNSGRATPGAIQPAQPFSGSLNLSARPSASRTAA